MGYCRIGIGALALLAAGVWLAPAGQPPKSGAGAKGGDPALIQRGDYLVNRVVLCADCHTPQDAKGRPDRARHARSPAAR